MILLSVKFVRFQVPTFLYSACIRGSSDRYAVHNPVFRQWFVALAQGRSFTKLVKGILTAREAFVFLTAPATNRIHENIWWAKMRAAGVPGNITSLLLEKIFASKDFNDPTGRLASVIRFYAEHYSQMTRLTLNEIMDFIAWKLNQDSEFSLQGRTVASVTRLTNEWHTLIQKAKLGHFIEWAGMELPEWQMAAKDKTWKVVELRTNRSLMDEGRKQRHCVYSYVNWCTSGRSAIFSLRSYRKIVGGYTVEGDIFWDSSLELDNRVTIEVQRQTAVIVQVRGRLNRMPTQEERDVIRHWAGEKGLVLRAQW